MASKAWGYELVLDAFTCDEEKMNDLDHIKKFVDELVEKADMKKMGELHYFYFEQKKWFLY